MSRLRLLILVGASVLASACAGETISGSGKVVSEPRPLAAFTKVSLGGSGQLTIERGLTDSLTVTTDDNLLSHIKAEVDDGELELGFKDPMVSFKPTKGVVFTVTVKELQGVEISGSGKAELKALDEPRLKVGISGSGDVSAQGRASDLDLSISGSGRYRGEELKSGRVKVEVSGSGSALVAASEILDAHVSGSGSIEYVGDPRVTQEISGSGKVRKH